MNSKILLMTFSLMLITSNLLFSQNTIKKNDKTNENLKKADEVVDKSIVLIGRLLKKKNKAKKQQNNTNDTLQNTTVDNTSTKTEEQASNTTILKGDAQDIPLTKEASLLFKNTISKTTNTEKNSITSAMNFKSTMDGTKFYINDQYSKEYAFPVSVYPLDINNDGKEEIAIVYGHIAISGDNIVSTLFIKDKEDKYRMNFGFAGSLILLVNKTTNFPDIAVGGPGFEFPVFRWNGKEYSSYNKVTDKQLEKLKPTYLEEVSKIYTASIKN